MIDELTSSPGVDQRAGDRKQVCQAWQVFREILLFIVLIKFLEDLRAVKNFLAAIRIARMEQPY